MNWWENDFVSVKRNKLHLAGRKVHKIINASRVGSRRRTRVTVAGNLCEIGDVFGKERLMPLPRSGQILAVLGAGAYCRSMASTFNLREIPEEVLI